MVQEICSKTRPVSGTNTHHDVTDLVNHRTVKNIKFWMSQERNITFLWNKRILNMCLRWYILRSHRFVAEVTFKYQNAYGQQTFQGGDMLWGVLTYKYTWHLNGIVLQGHVTNKIHIPTCRRYQHQTRQCADLVEETPKHDSLIEWPMWGHVIV